MLRSSSARQDASGLEQREGASRGVQGGGNEHPLVAGMDAQRNPARMSGLPLFRSYHWFPITEVSLAASVGFLSTIRVSGSCFPVSCGHHVGPIRTRTRLSHLYAPRRSFVK